MKDLESALAAVVQGDVTCLPTILTSSHPELQNAAANLPPLTVPRSALTTVLEQWRDGRCTSEDVQQWGSFVRWGFVAGKHAGGIYPIDIEYDASDEDLIAEIIGRFDELGDLIDGHIDDDEQQEMLRSLRA